MGIAGFAFLNSTKIQGSDLMSNTSGQAVYSPADSADDCAQICRNTPQCGGFVFNREVAWDQTGAGLCWLKGGQLAERKIVGLLETVSDPSSTSAVLLSSTTHLPKRYEGLNCSSGIPSEGGQPTSNLPGAFLQ